MSYTHSPSVLFFLSNDSKGAREDVVLTAERMEATQGKKERKTGYTPERECENSIVAKVKKKRKRDCPKRERGGHAIRVNSTVEGRVLSTCLSLFLGEIK